MQTCVVYKFVVKTDMFLSDGVKLLKVSQLSSSWLRHKLTMQRLVAI